jgi:LPXTG-site transpeptidase (sortase) family protein
MAPQVAKMFKYLTILAVIIVVGFGILNFDYFVKQIRYFMSETFVTDQQRQNIRDEHPIAVEPDQLIIPSLLDTVAPIQYITETNEPAFQAALKEGVVHFPGTAEVGQVGNVYIFGHSSDYALSDGKYKTIFALLPKIEMGAEILVSDHDGRQYKYIVYDKFVAEKNQVEVLSQETGQHKILTVQTSYPIGTALKRFIVKAELEDN